MPLTRVTTSAIGANAISADKMQNSSISTRHFQPGTITLGLLEANANTVAVETRVNANLDVLQDNVDIVSSNVSAVESRRLQNTTTFTTNINTVSSNVDTVSSNTTDNQTNINTVSSNVDTVQDNVATLSTNVTGIIDGTTQFTDDKIFQQNVTVQGNLIVVGSQVDLGVGTATIDDNFIVVSANLTGTPATDSGIIVNRGSEGNVFIGDHIAEDGIVFALSQSPHDNATIAIQEYLDVHANAFHAESGMNFSRVHFSHVDDESTGILIDTTNTHIKFIVGGSEQANLTSGGNLHLAQGSIHSGNLNGGNQIDLDDDSLADRQNSIVIRSLQSVGMFLDWNDSEGGNFFNIYDAEDDPNNVTKDDGLFSVRDTGDVFVDQSINIGTTANVNGVDLVSNDFVTFTRLNANLNVVSSNVVGAETRLNANLDIVQDNVAAIAGGGVLLTPFNNVNTATGTSNVFFIGQDVAAHANITTVSLDGIVQPNTEFVPNFSNDTIQFKDASIPSGTIVTINSLA